MKNKIKYLWLLLAAIAMAGCFEDKGNYDYRLINEVYIDTTGVRTSFSLGQYEELRITPAVKFSSGTGDENKLSYRWVFFQTEEDTFQEEISTERNLEVVITRDPGSYQAVLYVTYNDPSQYGEPLKATMTYPVTVQKNVLSGIVVLHANSEGTDIDYIATPYTVPVVEQTKWLKNIYSTANGRKMEGNPLMISELGRYSNYNPAQRTNRIYAGTDQEFLCLNAEDFSQARDQSTIFLNPPSRIMPYTMSGASFSAGPGFYTLINGDQAYCINIYGTAWLMEFYGPLSPGASLTGDLSFAPVSFTPSTTGNIATLYDNMGKRFVQIERDVNVEPKLLKFTDQDLAEAEFDVNNIGMDILYLGKGYNNDAFAVFTDNTNYWLYRMDFSNTDILTSTNLAKNRYNITTATSIGSARLFANGRNGEVFLYATDREIYSYSYAGTGQAARINNDFPAGETITAMHLVTYEHIPSWVGTYSEISGNILYVATWNGTEGKVYEFRISRSSGALENNREPLNTFTGLGRVAALSLIEEQDALN